MQIILKQANIWRQENLLLKNIDLNLSPGKHFFILGANGSGKSSLLEFLTGYLAPRPEEIKSRTYILNSKPSHSPLVLRPYISYLQPEQVNFYFEQELDFTVKEILASGPKDEIFPTLKFEQIYPTYKPIFKQFELTSLLDKPFFELSLGQARRVLLVRSLLKRPSFLFLDEFLLNLDLKTINNLLTFLKNYLQKHSLGLILTSHEFIKIPFNLTYLQIKNKKLISLSKTTSKISLTSSFSTSESSKKVISLKNCIVQRQNKIILKIDSFTLKEKEKIALLGPNGSGKTTFFKLIKGDIYPLKGGKIYFLNQNLPPRNFREQFIGFFSPEIQNYLDPNLSVLETIGTGFFSSFHPFLPLSASQQEKILALTQHFRCSELIKQKLKHLSFGQKIKILLLRSLIAKPKILLLDEPFIGLDDSQRNLFVTYLQKQRETTLIISSHQAELLESLCERGAVLFKNQLIFTGKFKEAKRIYLEKIG